MFGSTQILGKWVFLEVADPKLSVVIPNSPFSVGNQRFWGTPRLQFKAPHNGEASQTWINMVAGIIV
jgi:hypothetical protein